MRVTIFALAKAKRTLEGMLGPNDDTTVDTLDYLRTLELPQEEIGPAINVVLGMVKFMHERYDRV